MSTAIVTPAFVVNQLYLHDAKFWIVRDEAGKSVMARQEKDISIDESAELLTKVLGDVAGTVCVIIRDKDNKAFNQTQDKITGVFSFNVRCKSVSSLNTQNVGGSSAVGFEMILAQMQINNDLKFEMFKLQMLQNKESSIAEKAAEKLISSDGFILACTAFVGKLTGAPAAVAGPELSNGDKTDIEKAGELFKALDDQAPESLLKLAKYCNAHPGTWQEFKKGLQASNIL